MYGDPQPNRCCLRSAHHTHSIYAARVAFPHQHPRLSPPYHRHPILTRREPLAGLVAHLHFPPCLIGRVIGDQQNNRALKRTEGYKEALPCRLLAEATYTSRVNTK